MRKSSLDVSVSENINDTNALRLSEILSQTILSALQSKFPWEKIDAYSYRIIHIFPQTIRKESDIVWVAWKVQLHYNWKNYYITLPKSYYDLEKKIWNTPEWQNIWNKILHRLQNPSPKNRRWNAKKAIVRVASKVASALSRKPSNKSAN